MVLIMYPDTVTASIDDTGLTVDGVKYSQYPSGLFLLIEDVTAEAFIMNSNNMEWRYSI